MSAAPDRSSPPTLRPVEDADEAGVRALERTVGFHVTSPDYWRQLWSNPARPTDGVPGFGWVLEAEGRIVGHFGNIPMWYAYGDRDVMTASARGVAVDPTFRGHRLGVRLSETFFGQPGVDVVLSTTTNALAGGLFRKLGASHVPQPGYRRALFWVLRPERFAASFARGRGLPRALAAIAGGGGGLGLRLERALRGRRPRPAPGSPDTDVLGVDAIGDEFDGLWHAKRKEAARLLAFRDARYLRWHFSKPANLDATSVIVARSAGRLVGYAVVTRQPVRDTGMVRARLVDLLAEHDDPAIVDAVLAGSYDLAAARGADVLEVVGFPDAVRARVLAGRPFGRNLPAMPYLYKASRGDWHRALTDAGVWYASPFDGDASLRIG